MTILTLDTERIADVLAARALQPGTDAKEAQRLTNAEAALKRGLEPMPSLNGWLVPSRTTAGDVYRVVVHQHEDEAWCECSCPRGQVRKRCWHVSLIEVVETVQELAQ